MNTKTQHSKSFYIVRGVVRYLFAILVVALPLVLAGVVGMWIGMGK